MNTPYSRILSAARSQVWAIIPEHLEAMLAFLELRAAGGMADAETLAAIRTDSANMAARSGALNQAGGSVAILPLYGIISHRASMVSQMSGPGGTSVQSFTQQFRGAVNNPDVSAVIIDVDSPGGSTDGISELADIIFNARGKKPITAVSNCLCASAAIWLAASASELIVSPSSLTGSLGVYSVHEDVSGALGKEGVKITMVSAGKYKTENNPYEPLGDVGRAATQSMVNEFYSQFVNSVARGRKVSVSDARNNFGEGRVLTAQQAVKCGLADRVATLDQVLSQYGVSLNSGGGRAIPSPRRALAQLQAARAVQRRVEAHQKNEANFGSIRDHCRGNGI